MVYLLVTGCMQLFYLEVHGILLGVYMAGPCVMGRVHMYEQSTVFEYGFGRTGC